MPHHTPVRVLILGGSSEATAIVQGLAGRRDVEAILSLAGRTAAPPPQDLATRTGGFGGAGGLAAYILNEAIDIVVDATHPFAAQMTRHAQAACAMTGRRNLRVSRPAWVPEPGDRWFECDTIDACVAALGDAPRRVFLTIGSLRLAAFQRATQHRYVIRTIDPVARREAFPDATFITRRGPFDAQAEEDLMRAHSIDVVVTKNSGGAGASAKLVAARHLGIPVVLLRRPAEADCVGVAEALSSIAAHGVGAPRGV